MRRYQLLKRRYVDGLAPEAVQGELLVGRSEYYREHQQALEAVASLLGERLDAARAAGGTRPAEQPVAHAADAPSTGFLPVYLTSFVGREAAQAEVAGLLAGTRLLTLVGAGGCGKTRLAVHAAADLRDAYTAGVWFVDLAPLADPSLVPQAVLSALGLRAAPSRAPVAAVAAHLRGRPALLVLDNCEHLVEACARVAEALLAASSGLRVLATSREPLGVTGETVMRVPSLEMPEPEGATAAELVAAPAVRLFVDRASAAAPGFALTGATAAAVAQICRRLDGIPLALEMAAARVRVLSPVQIAARLDEAFGPGYPHPPSVRVPGPSDEFPARGGRFRLLTGGSRTAPTRQQTLRATLDWSHALLGEPERVLFRRLGVFAGGFALEAAEAVCAADDAAGAGEVLDLLTALVDKSLVVAEVRAGGERYRLLETVRAYALERLAEAHEVEALGARHAAHYLALAERAEVALEGRAMPSWLRRLEREHGNLRAALTWLAERNDAEAGLRLAAALLLFWVHGGHPGEGRAWLTRFLAAPAASAPTRVRALALSAAGWVMHMNGEVDSAFALLTEGLAISRTLRDDRAAARVMGVLGYGELHRRAPAAARRYLEEALVLARGVGDEWSAAFALGALSVASFHAGDLAAARSASQERLALARGGRDPYGVAGSLEWLGNVALAEGDVAAARALYAESLDRYREVGDRWGIAHALQGLGMATLEGGDGRTACAQLNECLAEQREIADLVWLAPTLEGLAGAEVAPAGEERDAPTDAARALRLAGAASALRASIDQPPSAPERARLERWLEPARRALPAEAAEAAWNAGVAMSLEQVLDYALVDGAAS